jgi:predicted transcriptional regulator of viral defense system
MKISDSNKLENGLWSQLNIYNKAENTDRSIYIIVKTNQNQSEKIDKLINVVNYRVSKGEKIPEILVIDSTYKESASVRK